MHSETMLTAASAAKLSEQSRCITPPVADRFYIIHHHPRLRLEAYFGLRISAFSRVSRRLGEKNRTLGRPDWLSKTRVAG